MSYARAGPNPETVADGYSVTDEREPFGGSDMAFKYEEEEQDEGPVPTGIEHHLPHPDKPVLHLSHPGEYRADFGQVPVSLRLTTATFALCAAFNSCSFGYDIGVTTVAGELVQKDMGLSDLQLELFLGTSNLCALVGALMAHFFSDRYGRRSTFLVAAAGYLAGAGILATAPSYTLLMVGRAFVGLGVGVGLTIDPIYQCEIAPAAFRGELVAWSEIATNLGMCVGLASGFFMGKMSDLSLWRNMFALGGFFAGAMIFLVIFILPESPRWFVSRRRYPEARAVLRRVYPRGYDIEPILLDIEESNEREIRAEKGTGWNIILFPTRAFSRMLLVGVGTAIAQQASGVVAIYFFLTYVLGLSGIDNKNVQTSILIFVGIVKILFVFIGAKLFDRKGRRPTMFISLVGTTLTLMMLSVNFYGSEYSTSFAIFALSLYMALFSLGMGPGGWLIPAEVFPTNIRAKAVSVSTFLNRAIATLVSTTFLSTGRAMSWSAYFFLLAIINAFLGLFLYKYLAETRGRSLESMSLYFAEITADQSILEAEARLVRDRRAEIHAEATAPAFQPTTTRERPPEISQDAVVVGKMA